MKIIESNYLLSIILLCLKSYTITSFAEGEKKKKVVIQFLKESTFIKIFYCLLISVLSDLQHYPKTRVQSGDFVTLSSNLVN